MLPEMRQVLQALAPTQPTRDLKTMRDALNTMWPAALRRRRMVSDISWGNSPRAQRHRRVRHCVYDTERRTREFGIRLALNATPAAIVRHILRSGGGIITIALVAGSIGAAAAASLIRTFLLVSPTNVSIYLTVVLILLLVSLLAYMVPKLRAARTNPTAALRGD